MRRMVLIAVMGLLCWTASAGCVLDEAVTTFEVTIQPSSTSVATAGTVQLEAVVVGGFPEIEYLWQQTGGPTATIQSPNSAVTDVTLPVPGTYVFTVTATDATGRTAVSLPVSVDAI